MEFNYSLFHIHSSLEQQVLGKIKFLTRLEIYLFSAIITKINSLHRHNFFVSLLLSICDGTREIFHSEKSFFYSHSRAIVEALQSINFNFVSALW